MISQWLFGGVAIGALTRVADKWTGGAAFFVVMGGWAAFGLYLWAR